MARRNAPRSIGGETNLARRIERERRARGWSYDTLAKAMTEHGCPLTASALFKIEKSDPPRKISVDELVALAMVFDTTIDDLLTPLEMLDDQRATQLARELDKTDRTLAETVGEVIGLWREMFALGTDQAVFDDVQHQRGGFAFTALPALTDAQGNAVEPTREFSDALLKFYVAMISQAGVINGLAPTERSIDGQR
jgi:transcriptional regulator with XRE-family HTH domain